MWEEGERCARAGLSQISWYSQDSFAFHMLLSSLKDKERAKHSCFLTNCPVAEFGVCATKLSLPHPQLPGSLSGSCPQLSPGAWMSRRENVSFARPAVAVN